MYSFSPLCPNPDYFDLDKILYARLLVTNATPKLYMLKFMLRILFVLRDSFLRKMKCRGKLSKIVKTG